MSPVLNIQGSWITQDSVYVFGSECARVLHIPELWICLWFWICDDSEYTRVLNMLGLHRLRICLNNSWIYLNMPDYAWICLNMIEYAEICVNTYIWLNDFCFTFPHFPIFYKPLSTWTHDYSFECLQETRGYGLKEHGTAFLKRQNLIFSIAAGSIWFVFCFRLNIFASKV